MAADAAVSVDVIFLDIDGVLLPFGGDLKCCSREKSCSGLFPDRTLEALSRIVAETGAKVVLSSTWRARRDFIQDIIRAFRAYSETFGGPLGSITDFHSLTSLENHSERQWEIHDWLFDHRGSVRAWVALDDEELLEDDRNAKNRKQFLGHVVKTKSDIGLTMENSEAAIKLFQKQLNER